MQLNASLPGRIVVFRDGVGDGQMATVAEYEVPQISSCFSLFGRSPILSMNTTSYMYITDSTQSHTHSHQGIMSGGCGVMLSQEILEIYML